MIITHRQQWGAAPSGSRRTRAMRRAVCAAICAVASAAPVTGAGIGAAAVRVPGVARYRANALLDGTTEALGIPYAEPPVGGRRFRPPSPLPPCSSKCSGGDEPDEDASRFGRVCMQLALGYEGNVTDKVAAHMGEDCLTLNVWSPANASALPVYFWIHGGAFIQGSGSWFNGSALAAQGLVVVTINYRVGVFGFLNLDGLAGGVDGNATSGGVNGLLDQVEALRWVRAHIAAFGGDPSRVTIGGESAGSLSVCDHLHMPVTRGLFRRTILKLQLRFLAERERRRGDARHGLPWVRGELHVPALADR